MGPVSSLADRYQSSAKSCAWPWVPSPYLAHFSICSSWPLAASLPGMWERTLTIGSAGKSFSATGWKVSAATWQVAAVGGLTRAPLALRSPLTVSCSRWAGFWVQILS